MPRIQYIDAKRLEVRTTTSDVCLGYVERLSGSRTAGGHAYKAIDVEGGETEHRGLKAALDRLTGWLKSA